MYCEHQWHVVGVFGTWQFYGKGIKYWKACKKCGEIQDLVRFEDHGEDAEYNKEWREREGYEDKT